MWSCILLAFSAASIDSKTPLHAVTIASVTSEPPETRGICGADILVRESLVFAKAKLSMSRNGVGVHAAAHGRTALAPVHPL